MSRESSRLSLSLALGMLAGCGPEPAGTTVGDPGATNPAATASTDTTATTDPPTTGASNASTSGAVDASTTGPSDASTTGPSTGGSTDPVLTSTGMTSTTSSEGSSGPDSSTGDDTGSECIALMQAFTDPPVPSGWEKCGDLLPHRVSAEVCQVPAVPSDCPFDGQACKTNADCQHVPFGSCQKWTNLSNCNCVAGCATDADCEPGHVCRCAGDVLGPTSTCVPSNCESDAACGDQRCQFAQSEGIACGAQIINGSCTTPNDKCDSDLPCEDLPCSPVGDNDLWVCNDLICD